MVSCKELVDLAMDFIRKDLEPDRMVRLEKHLERCPSCLNFIRTYDRVPSLSRELLHREMPREVKDSLMDFLQAELLDKNTSNL